MHPRLSTPLVDVPAIPAFIIRKQHGRVALTIYCAYRAGLAVVFLNRFRHLQVVAVSYRYVLVHSPLV